MLDALSGLFEIWGTAGSIWVLELILQCPTGPYYDHEKMLQHEDRQAALCESLLDCKRRDVMADTRSC